MNILNFSQFFTSILFCFLRFVNFTSKFNTFVQYRLELLLFPLNLKLVFIQRIGQSVWHRRSALIIFPRFRTNHTFSGHSIIFFFICGNHPNPIILCCNLTPSRSNSKLLSAGRSVNRITSHRSFFRMNASNAVFNVWTFCSVSTFWWTLGSIYYIFFSDGVVNCDCSFCGIYWILWILFY
jgi:hypothetical protein